MMGDLARGGGVDDASWESVRWSSGMWRKSCADVFVCLYCLLTRNEGVSWYADTDSLDFRTNEPGPALSLGMVDKPRRAELV